MSVPFSVEKGQLGGATASVMRRIRYSEMELRAFALEKAKRPLKPAEMTARLLDPVRETKQSLNAKINAELRRMANRKDAEIEKLPKARYRLKKEGPAEKPTGPG